MAKRKSPSKSLRSRTKYPERASQVLVTQAMLYGVRDELKTYINSKVHGVKSEVQGLKSEIHGVRAEIQGLKSEVHRIGLLVEEQNARNAIVLDGLSNLFSRQERIESEFVDLRRDLAAAK